MKIISRLTVLMCLIGFNAQATRLSAIEIQVEKERLDAVCEISREQRLAPERDELIADCVENKNKELSYCIRYHSDLGDRINYPNGNVKLAEYYDTPECEEAFQFRRQD